MDDRRRWTANEVIDHILTIISNHDPVIIEQEQDNYYPTKEQKAVSKTLATVINKITEDSPIMCGEDFKQH